MVADGHICSVCNKAHWSNEPIMPAPNSPAWSWRYFCGQCPRELQPRDGFGVCEFARHQFSHVEGALQEASRDAHQYRHSLEAIDHLATAKDLGAWPVAMFRYFVGHHVDLSIRRDDPPRTPPAEILAKEEP